MKRLKNWIDELMQDKKRRKAVITQTICILVILPLFILVSMVSQQGASMSHRVRTATDLLRARARLAVYGEQEHWRGLEDELRQEMEWFVLNTRGYGFGEMRVVVALYDGEQQIRTHDNFLIESRTRTNMHNRAHEINGAWFYELRRWYDNFLFSPRIDFEYQIFIHTDDNRDMRIVIVGRAYVLRAALWNAMVPVSITMMLVGGIISLFFLSRKRHAEELAKVKEQTKEPQDAQ